MHLTQLISGKVEIQNDSLPLLFTQGSPRVNLSEARTEDWIVQFIRKLGQINLERMRFEPYHITTCPGISISDTPIYESTTTSTDFEACLAHEEKILVGEFMGPCPTPSSALSRLRARQPQILRRALEIRQEYGDPIQNLAELLGNMPGSQEDWKALIDEPYY